MSIEQLEQEGVKQVFNYTEVSLSIRNNQHPEIREKIRSSQEGAAYVKNLFGMDIETKEMFFSIMLNSAQEILAVYKVSTGGINSCLIDHRLIFSAALHCLATQILICHNHPSGRATPSNADKKTTEEIQKACKIMQINLMDHLIITDYDYYSFADNGEI